MYICSSTTNRAACQAAIMRIVGDSWKQGVFLGDVFQNAQIEQRQRANTTEFPDCYSYAVVTQLGRGSLWTQPAPKYNFLDSSVFAFILSTRLPPDKFCPHVAVCEVRFHNAFVQVSSATNIPHGVRKAVDWTRRAQTPKHECRRPSTRNPPRTHGRLSLIHI